MASATLVVFLVLTTVVGQLAATDAAGSGAGGSSAVFRARADAAAGGRSRSGSDVMPPVSSWILQEQFELRPLLDRCSEDCIDCLRSSTESCIGWGAIIDRPTVGGQLLRGQAPPHRGMPRRQGKLATYVSRDDA
ncbi:hypothetical protein U9M48_044255 [Paspalum notatum var. saurae]|uniref:Uncharacterized protein n=1 Tax=Paspalum notatum var. saurae TaxID=547442 RepID=A0AAQ3UUP3_PASNO